MLERRLAEHLSVLGRARAIYRDEEPERWDDLHDRLGPFAERVILEIRRI